MKYCVASFLLSVSLLVASGSWEEAKGQISPITKKSVTGTASANPQLPVLQPRPATKITTPLDFHLPGNLPKPIDPPKVIKAVVTLPLTTSKPAVTSGTLSGIKGLDLPHASGLTTFQTKLPAGTKIVPVKDFHKNMSVAILKQPTKLALVDVSLKKYEPQAMVMKNNMQKQYVKGQWFTANWWKNHPVAVSPWHYSHHHHHHPHWWWWQTPNWVACNNWLIYRWADPFYYDCGVNVVYRNNFVYVHGVEVASMPTYAYQAFQLAAVAAPPSDQQLEWLPLGVYSLASSRYDPFPDLVLQLAVTKQGLISGTLYSRSSNTTVAVSGQVEPLTQRVAIQLSNNGDLVLDTWFYNLTLPHTCVFMHFGVNQTQTWFLVRMDALPKE